MILTPDDIRRSSRLDVGTAPGFAFPSDPAADSIPGHVLKALKEEMVDEAL